MDPLYQDYLGLLEDLRRVLDQLTGVTQKKLQAARQDDLAALNKCIKQEQAMSLSLRSIDRKRDDMLARLGLTQVPLVQLAGRYPEALRPQAKETTEALHRSYETYRSASEAARVVMERALHDIDRMLAEAEAPVPSPKEAPSSPPQLKTDIRA